MQSRGKIMVTAKQPGIGQGKGGGRPKREAVVRMRLDLSPRAAALVQARAEADGRPIWQVIDSLIIAGLAGEAPPPKLPPQATQLAQEAAAFLVRHQDRHEASKFLQRAWSQALVIASRDLD